MLVLLYLKDDLEVLGEAIVVLPLARFVELRPLQHYRAIRLLLLLEQEMRVKPEVTYGTTAFAREFFSMIKDDFGVSFDQQRPLMGAARNLVLCPPLQVHHVPMMARIEKLLRALRVASAWQDSWVCPLSLIKLSSGYCLYASDHAVWLTAAGEIKSRTATHAQSADSENWLRASYERSRPAYWSRY
mmetsp:Transcript_3554/g.5937  ORF Transcript_3554/g.5937 Transcript_3554/m.5937 type:complete len:187 (-) Transcript_3554:167-727(-)